MPIWQLLFNMFCKFLRYLSTKRAINYKMHKVYMRNENQSNELHINFRYINEKFKVDREFNFCRQLNENVSVALNRIKSNIEKEFNKKNKKSKKKVTAEEEVKTEITNQEVNILKYFIIY